MGSNGSKSASPGAAALLISALLISALQGGCATQVAVGDDEVGVNEQAIQEAYVAFSENSTVRWVQLQFGNSMSHMGKSTGVLRGFSSNQGGFWFNCGVTFISPRFAVTAAHCVDTVDVPSGVVAVTHVNTRNLQSGALVNSTVVTGSWPNYTHPVLNAAAGYVTTSFTCTVEVACDSQYRRTANCPLSSTTQVDMALLRCNERPTHPTYGSSWVPVDANDTGTKQVESWWYHEIYQLATQSSGAQPGPAGNFAHYGAWAKDDKANNYHYRQHSYLPLRSSTWPGGTPYKQIGNNTLSTKTDMPVCHGQSGSGVFERGTSLLFGPVSLFGTASSRGRTCDDYAAKSSGQHLSDHIRRTQTVKLENMTIVQNDRAGTL